MVKNEGYLVTAQKIGNLLVSRCCKDDGIIGVAV